MIIKKNFYKKLELKLIQMKPYQKTSMQSLFLILPHLASTQTRGFLKSHGIRGSGRPSDPTWIEDCLLFLACGLFGLFTDLCFRTPDDPNEILCCSICLDDQPRASGVTMPVCGHWFCTMCTTEQLESSISEGNVNHITCMQQECGKPVPPSIIEYMHTPFYCSPPSCSGSCFHLPSYHSSMSSLLACLEVSFFFLHPFFFCLVFLFPISSKFLKSDCFVS